MLLLVPAVLSLRGQGVDQFQFRVRVQIPSAVPVQDGRKQCGLGGSSVGQE
jgi:hypothetical protein